MNPSDIALFVLLGPHAVCSIALLAYALHHFALFYWAARYGRCTRPVDGAPPPPVAAHAAEDWPVVTTQLPIYNEGPVAARVIDAVARQDYPRARHQILVLDDSTDETLDVTRAAAARWRAAGVDVQVLHRADRTGYKAGALAEAMRQTRGDFIALFDADFVPPPDFLRRAVHGLRARSDVACLQGRWDHLNRDAGWLTRAQGLAIDGHFMIEQPARCGAGLFLNFNGTAGVWRRAAIDDPRVGGWQHDTVTEDLDLSYRAQMCGWKIVYRPDLPCPAELPADLSALRIQQRRWARGSTQTAVKLLGRLWRTPLPLRVRIEGTFHLAAYSIAVWMAGLALLSWPMWCLWPATLRDERLWPLWTLMMTGAIAPPILYLSAAARLGRARAAVADIPGLVLLGAGLCLDNASAVVSGLRRRGGVFDRTPKTGACGAHRGVNRYRSPASRMRTWELLLGLYSAAGAVHCCIAADWIPAAFIGLYAAGFLTVSLASGPSADRRRTRTASPPPPSSSEVPAPVASAALSPALVNE